MHNVKKKNFVRVSSSEVTMRHNRCSRAYISLVSVHKPLLQKLPQSMVIAWTAKPLIQTGEFDCLWLHPRPQSACYPALSSSRVWLPLIDLQAMQRLASCATRCKMPNPSRPWVQSKAIERTRLDRVAQDAKRCMVWRLIESNRTHPFYSGGERRQSNSEADLCCALLSY